MRCYWCSMPRVGARGWDSMGFWDGTWGPNTIGTQSWTIDGEGPFFSFFLDGGLDWRWVTMLW